MTKEVEILRNALENISSGEHQLKDPYGVKTTMAKLTRHGMQNMAKLAIFQASKEADKVRGEE